MVALFYFCIVELELESSFKGKRSDFPQNNTLQHIHVNFKIYS